MAYIFLTGENFNVELVKQGLSPYYTKYGTSRYFHDELVAAEVYGKKHGLNVWNSQVKTGRQYNKPPPTVSGISKYVASRKSKVFHRSTCRHALKIYPGNLIKFDNRVDAVNSGRRGCKVCRP